MPSTRAPLRHLPDPLPIVLLEAREAAGWSQRQAAEHTGVSRGMLQHLEHGRRVPSLDVADALVTAYRLDDRDPAAAAQLRRIAVPRGRSSPYRRTPATLCQDVPMGASVRSPAPSLAHLLAKALP